MIEFLVKSLAFLGKAIEAVALIGGLMAFAGALWLTCSRSGIRLMEWLLQDPEELEDEYEA